MKNKKKKSNYFIALLVICIQVSVMAEKISFSANTMKKVLAAGKEKTLLDGNARIESGDILIMADHIEIYGKNNNFVYSESEEIIVINEKKGIKITCQNLFYDRDQKVLRIRGNATMEDKKNEVLIKGGYIEHWEEKDLTFIQIGVRILKENLVCRAESAKYEQEKERLELTGMPVVVKDGDEFKALKININLENDDVELLGNVEGAVTYEEEDKTGEAPNDSEEKPAVPEKKPGVLEEKPLNPEAKPESPVKINETGADLDKDPQL